MIHIEEVNEIFEQVRHVLAYSQQIDNVNINQLKQQWHENKAVFVKLFGDKLIYEVEKPVTFHLTKDAQEKIVWEFINNECEYGNEEFGHFIEENKNGFFKNKVIHNYKLKSGKVITKGTRLLKAFKYFFPDETSLHRRQNRASEIIQQNKITGKFCISVHPLDYLSSSENTHGWRSCHALDGEYRAGNLSYMMDGCTLVCYLKSKEHSQLPRFPEDLPWNNKKWRMLLYLSNDRKMMFAGRQYPFSSDSALKLIQNLANQSPELDTITPFYYLNAHWCKFMDTHIDNFRSDELNIDFSVPYYPIGGELRKLDKIVLDAADSCHYNDILFSNYYTPQCSQIVHDTDTWITKVQNEAATTVDTKFLVGKMVQCVHCLNDVVISGNSTIMCNKCEKAYGTSENLAYSDCYYCGDRTWLEDCIFVEDQVICPHCEHNTFCCKNCDNVFLEEHFGGTDEYDNTFCIECWESIKEDE